ncbi:hypothetical protein [Streptomyces sp. NWU339]|nr:hypothetical protein [Streptomyces sp. NWU339]
MDTQTRLAAAHPVPGRTADAKVWRGFGLAEHCQEVTGSATAPTSIPT